MTLANTFYHLVTKRTSTWAFSIVVGALLFERVFDATADSFFEAQNKGKLWKDIKHQYEDKD